MAPLPPPPPPAPPPPPLGGPVAATPKVSKSEAMDRNALLSQIRGGARLKKTTAVNDRSAPLVDGKSSKTSSGVGSKPISNGPGGAPMQLGGLFAGGIPKLKSTGSKLVSNGLTVSANKVNNSCTKSDQTATTGPTKTDSIRSLNTSSLKTSLEEKLTNNNNNSSFLHNSKISSSNNSSYELNYNNNNKFHTMKAREKPSYVTSEHKGQAPQVPTQTIRSNAPELPKKPPGVQRSNSQSSGRISSNTGRRPGPPNIKPPPPPKMTNGLSPQSSQPTQQSNPLNINRRQSFTDEKSNSSAVRSGGPGVSALVSNLNQQLNRTDRPPAPLRNVNPVVNGVSQSPAYPPPPPPVSTIPNRPNNSGPRMQTIKSNAPNIPIQVQKTPSNFRPPLGPPSPPPHRTTSNNTPNCPLPPPPPSQTKVIPTTMRNGSALGPPPPIRNTSMSRDETSFASRFQQFKAVFELPAPTPPTISNKQYPSHMQQSQRRRDPPPPPPQSNGMANHSPNLNAHNNYGKKLTNPVLHIQIGSTAAQS